MLAGGRPSWASPSSTALAGSPGVEAILTVAISPLASSTRTMSVNVPPVSMPIRHAMADFPQRPANAASAISSVRSMTASSCSPERNQAPRSSARTPCSTIAAVRRT